MNLGSPAAPEFPVPSGIPSAVTLHELALLQRFAHEARTVLEIGTHYGFSCIGMALAGVHVTSVDPHFEGPADTPDTWGAFTRNLERHGFMRREGTTTRYGLWTPFLRGGSHVNAHRLAIEDFEFEPYEEFGLVFIDGNHTWPCPSRDTEIAMAHLTAPGYIAFHDVTPNWPGVYRATLQLEAKGWREVGRVQTLRVYQRP